ncbi:DUF4259 domain-containing protein [Streptomyces sp. P6-2-1]|uniref:DUF4259 domain-containing protein n=1 Tax=unclassified Streptomyces TaxID=2593676 RepID=UPI003D361B9C
MGTWDSGPFDNDTAADWCDELDDTEAAGRAELVRAALAYAADTPPDAYLDDAEHAVAAAALVAAQCPRGEAAGSGYGPKEPLPDLTALRPLALAALERVLTAPCELLALWEGAPSWHGTMDRLRAALEPEPVGEPRALD